MAVVLPFPSAATGARPAPLRRRPSLLRRLFTPVSVDGAVRAGVERAASPMVMTVGLGGVSPTR